MLAVQVAWLSTKLTRSTLLFLFIHPSTHIHKCIHTHIIISDLYVCNARGPCSVRMQLHHATHWIVLMLLRICCYCMPSSFSIFYCRDISISIRTTDELSFNLLPAIRLMLDHPCWLPAMSGWTESSALNVQQRNKPSRCEYAQQQHQQTVWKFRKRKI